MIFEKDHIMPMIRYNDMISMTVNRSNTDKVHQYGMNHYERIEVEDGFNDCIHDERVAAGESRRGRVRGWGGALGEARAPGGAGRRPPPRETGRRPSTQGGREGGRTRRAGRRVGRGGRAG